MPKKKAHTLHVIGGIGSKYCFLDISREAAMTRYQEITGVTLSVAAELTKTFSFTDEFAAYDVWER